MKKTFTILIAAIAAILMMAQPTKVMGQAKPDPTYEWVLVEDYSSLSTSETYVIACNINGGTTWYSLKNNQVTTAANLPIGNTLTIVNKKITSTVSSDETWVLEAVTNQTDQFYIKSTKGSYYLQNAGATKSTIATKSSTDNQNIWKIHYTDSNNSNTSVTGLYNVGASRELACYDSSPVTWRCYAGSNYSNIQNDEVVLYKRQEVSSDPTITLSKTSLTGFNYNQGFGPSASQSFKVSGSNLGGNNIIVSLNANSDYEMSEQDGNNWSSITSKTLTPTNGTVGETTLYVRMKSGLTGNEITGTITASATGATSKSITLSGSVTPTYTITYSATNGNISGVLAGTQTTVADGARLVEDTEVTLTAQPADGYKFTSWGVEGTGSSLSSTSTNPTTFTMGTSNSTVTATFTARTPAKVTLHDGLNGAIETEVNTYTDATLTDVIEGHDIASVNGWTALGWVKSYTSGTPTLITTSEAVGTTTNLYAVYKKGSNTFTLVTGANNNDIEVNATYMICGYGGSSYYLMGDAGTNVMNRTTSITVTNNSFEYSVGKKFVLGGQSGAYTFYDGSKYLETGSDANTLLTLTDELSNYGKWDISFSNNIVQIRKYGTSGNTSRYVSYYHSGTNFNCYTSTNTLYLFKQTSNDLQYTITPSAEKCHVTYDANGATSGDVPTDEGVYDPNDNVTVKGNTGSLAKTGYTWSGWCLNAEGTGTVYGPTPYTTTYPIPANTTFYAKWNINSYTYNLDDTDEHVAAGLEVGGESYTASTIPYNTEVEVVVDTDDGYGYTISVKDGDDNDVTLTNNTFNMPASTVSITVTSYLYPKYTLVTSADQIKPGKHYVFASTGVKDVAGYAMGYNRGNNRSAEPVTPYLENTKTKITINDDIYEFVISGSSSNTEYWTIYDETNSGYVKSTTASSNNMQVSSSALDDCGKWTITIGASDKVATIKAQGNGDRKYMRLNGTNNPPIFSCYESGKQSDVYLYIKDDDNDGTIYSATTIGTDISYNNLTIIKKVVSNNPVVNGIITVPNAKTLTVTGTLTNQGDAANLIINDGGQLITLSTGVKATIEKYVNQATNGTTTNWYLISSPVGTVSTDVVEVNDINLYAYNEANLAWNGYESTSHGFENLVSGKGYLYRNSEETTLSFTGEVVTGTVSGISLSCERDDDFAGFNLLGNPYSRKITSSCISLSNDATFSGVYTLGTDGNWYSAVSTDINPCEGFLVQVNKATTATFGTPAKGTTYNNDYIQFTVANSQYEDVTYALFRKGNGLSKINHRNAEIPMLYINQNDRDYAIANFSDNTKSFNLNFKAMTTGKYTLSYNTTGEYNYLHVIDRLTGADVDMLLEGEYSFIATPSDNTNRFIVRLEYMPNYSEGNAEIFAFQNGNEILVSGSGELQIFDVTGRSVMTTTINGAESINIPTQGVYIFRLVGNEVKTQKIVVR